jgi:hypothetical protein
VRCNSRMWHQEGDAAKSSLRWVRDPFGQKLAMSPPAGTILHPPETPHDPGVTSLAAPEYRLTTPLPLLLRRCCRRRCLHVLRVMCLVLQQSTDNQLEHCIAERSILKVEFFGFDLAQFIQ